MRATARMKATTIASNLLTHYTNSAIMGRNILEDGVPDQNVSVDELEKALGPRMLKLIQDVNDMCIDDEDEKVRVEQRKAQRAANAPNKQPANVSDPVETEAEKRLKRRKRA